jgi:hypothetical protein
MTYSVGGLIEATDYNGFVNTGANNINAVWGVGSGDSGWGQTAISTVSAGGTVTATQWATLVANLATAGQQTNSTLTSRTQPSAGNTIAILANVATDINTITNNRGNAAASGTTIGTFSGTTSKTTATGSGTAAWTITFTHAITFANANSARYFFNAGGLVKVMYGKSGGSTDNDPEWNTFAGQCGNIFLSGDIRNSAQTIAGTSYTGVTRIGGTGGTQTTLATTTGFYDLSTSPITLFQLNQITAPYTGEYIRTTASVNANASPTVLTITTTWVSDGSTGAGSSADISGGSALASPATAISGAALGPTTLVNLIPPSTTYLTNSWGTPTIAASVA